MTLRDAIVSQGNWLFRHRGTLPLLILPLFLAAVYTFETGETQNRSEGWFQFLGLATAFFGLIVRVYTIGTVPRGTSGRNTTSQEAAVLNTTGPYSILRHPLYVGNYFIMLGCAIFVGVWWLPILITPLFWLYYERIAFAEEEYLLTRFGSQFTEWARVTPAFLPSPRRWRPTMLPFSWRTVLCREYGALLTILALCSLTELIGDLFFDRPPHVEVLWALVLVIAIAQAVTLRLIKRKTVLLRVDGRP